MESVTQNLRRTVDQAPSLGLVVGYAARQPAETRAVALRALVAAAIARMDAAARESSRLAHTMRWRSESEAHAVAKNGQSQRLAADGTSLEDRQAAARAIDELDAAWLARQAELEALRTADYHAALVRLCPDVLALASYVQSVEAVEAAAAALELEPSALVLALGDLPQEPVDGAALAGLLGVEAPALVGLTRPAPLTVETICGLYYGTPATVDDNAPAEAADATAAVALDHAARDLVRLAARGEVAL